MIFNAEQIVADIYQSGGRFLKQASSLLSDKQEGADVWQEVDSQAARLKVAYTFRTFRKKVTGGGSSGEAQYYNISPFYRRLLFEAHYCQ